MERSRENLMPTIRFEVYESNCDLVVKRVGDQLVCELVCTQYYDKIVGRAILNPTTIARDIENAVPLDAVDFHSNWIDGLEPLE
jgi:hypothetical protein